MSMRTISISVLISRYSDLAIELMSQLDLLDEYGEEDQQGASDDLEEQDQEIETEASDEGAEEDSGSEGDLSDAIEGEVPVDMDAADLIDADTEDESGAPPDQQVEQNWSRPKVFEYKSYTSEFDEIVFADELCEGEELDGCVASLTSIYKIRRSSSVSSLTACRESCWLSKTVVGTLI